MLPEFPSVGADSQVSDALASLRDLGDNRYEFNRVYVVDEDGSLAGQLTMVDLALLPERTPVREVMDPVPAAVTADTSAAECARLRRHYNVVQLPVLADGKLIGSSPWSSSSAPWWRRTPARCSMSAGCPESPRSTPYPPPSGRGCPG